MGSNHQLRRLPSQGRIAGVCAGIAEYFDTDVTLVRLVWLILSIVPGGIIGGLIVYVAAWVIMPEGDAPAVHGARRLARSRVDRKIAGVCGGMAEYLEIDSALMRLIWVVLTVIPGAIVFGLLAYVVAWFIIPTRDLPTVAAASSSA